MNDEWRRGSFSTNYTVEAARVGKTLKGDATAQGVYWYVHSCRNSKSGVAYVTNSDIQEGLCLKKDAVTRAKKRLHESGLVVIKNGNGSGRATVYTFPIDNYKG